MSVALTYLYVPGDRPERFDKALASGADAIVLDLEDAVAADRKVLARETVARWIAALAPGSVEVWVRVNPGALREADIRAVAHPRLTGGVAAEGGIRTRRRTGRWPPDRALSRCCGIRADRDRCRRVRRTGHRSCAPPNTVSATR